MGTLNYFVAFDTNGKQGNFEVRTSHRIRTFEDIRAIEALLREEEGLPNPIVTGWKLLRRRRFARYSAAEATSSSDPDHRVNDHSTPHHPPRPAP